MRRVVGTHTLPDPLVELIAHRVRVLGEPARIKLLDALRAGPASVGELAGRLGLSQQNTSKWSAPEVRVGVVQAASLVPGVGAAASWAVMRVSSRSRSVRVNLQSNAVAVAL